MQELRFVAVSEDGSYAVLAVPGRSGRYILPIDERLRAVALGQTSRLAQYEIEVESPLRPKEIQARIRAGETAEEIADAAGIPVERVRWFEGPVLAERAYIADQAQTGSVRRAGDSAGPGPRLGDIVTARLSAAGTDPADGQWDSRKRGDGNWQVSLTFPSGGRLHVAEWVFDPRRRHVMPDDDNAARLSLPESELPAEPVPVPGEATVTPIASRLGAAAGMGGGTVGGPGVSRFRPDRSVIPDRSLGVDRSLADRPMPPSAPAPERTVMSDRPVLSDRPAVSDRFAAPERPATPAPQRPAQQDRPGYQDHPGYQERPSYQGRPANPGYAEFPESAPYRAPEPANRDQAQEPPGYRAQAAEPPAHRGYGDPASVSSAYRAQIAEPPAYREAAPEPRAYREPAPEEAFYRAPAPHQPAYRDPAPEPAAHRGTASDVPSDQVASDQIRSAQVSPVSDAENSERVRPAPPRPVIFDDPEPAFVAEQPEPNHALVQPAAPVPTAPEPAPATEKVVTTSVISPETQDSRPGTAPSAAAPSHGSAVREVPAPATAVIPAPAITFETNTAPEANTAPEGAIAPEPADVPRPEAREPEPAAMQVEPATAVAAPSIAEPEVIEGTGSAEAVTAAEADPRPTVTAAQVAPTDEGTPTGPSVPGEPAAAALEPTAPEPKADPAAAEPIPAEDQPSRQRPGAKKNAKGRRSSVPSWDEIMLGSSRQRE